MIPPDNYEALDRETMLIHLRSYANAIHDLSERVQKLQWRLELQNRHREMIDKAFEGKGWLS